MRKVFFFSFILLGGCAGYLWGLHDDWPTRLVMMGGCLLVAAAIGGALSSAGKQRRDAPLLKRDDFSRLPSGAGTDVDDLVANYWRDEGYPPFNKPTEYEHVSGKKT